jgi:hypothetical protein
MATKVVDNCLVCAVFVAADTLGSEAYPKQRREVALGWATA